MLLFTQAPSTSKKQTRYWERGHPSPFFVFFFDKSEDSMPSNNLT